MPSPEFASLVRSVRAGDPEAARALVAQYESIVRVTVRYRLTDPRLRAAFDSADICQSVFSAFFLQAAGGSFDLDSPEQLGHLLVGIAKNKVAAQVRHLAAERRDYRRGRGDPARLDDVPDQAPTPGRHAEGKELLSEVWRRFSPAERELAAMRQQGLSWAAIADRFQDTPVAIRKRFSRAVDRVARELGLDGPTIRVF